MGLDPHLWQSLEERGLCQSHLELLLTALELQRNGHLGWHFVHGRLEQVDLRVIMPGKRFDMGRVAEALALGLDGHAR